MAKRIRQSATLSLTSAFVATFGSMALMMAVMM